MMGVPQWIIGWMGAAYYSGMLLGSHLTAKFILRVGHIRAYGFFAAIMILAILTQYFWDMYASWAITRFLIGYALGALYLVIESWLFNLASPDRKGSVIGLYTFILYLGSFFGQINFRFIDLVKPDAFILPACFIVASLFPVSATHTHYPKFEEHEKFDMFKIMRLAPVGSLNTLVSGLIISSMHVLLPIFLYKNNYSKENLAILLAMPLLGAICLQYIIGRVSDFVNRRKLLVLLHTFNIAAMALVIILTGQLFWIGAALFMQGCMFYSIYPIAMAHTCDRFSSDEYFGVIRTLLILYGIGSIAGPTLAAYFMTWFQPAALLWFLGAVSLFAAIFTQIPYFRQPRMALEEQKTQFVHTQGKTPISADLDPRTP